MTTDGLAGAVLGLSFIAAATTEPMALPISVALGIAIVIAMGGSLFDSYHSAAVHDRKRFIGKVGLSGVCAVVFFSISRTRLEDSLQAASVAGACGIFGRHLLEIVVISKLKKLGWLSDDDARDVKSGG